VFKRLPALTKSTSKGCANCGENPIIADMGMLIAVGFGSACVSKDGETVYDERDKQGQIPCEYCNIHYDCEHCEDTGWYTDFWTVADAEKEALKDPDHDWRIIKDAPLYSATYQRQGAGKWVSVASGRGFA